MIEAKSRFETEHSRKYMVQLCKHFAHKIETVHEGDHGECRFAFGTAKLDADDSGLDISIGLNSAEDLERAKHVIESHLMKFAFREPRPLAWSVSEAAH